MKHLFQNQKSELILICAQTLCLTAQEMNVITHVGISSRINVLEMFHT